MTRGNDASGQKMFSADIVSFLLAAVDHTSISKSQFDIMSALDGTRTASSFEHQFRSITQKAKELKSRLDNGEKFTQVSPSKKRGANTMGGQLTPPVTPAKKTKATPKVSAKGKKVAKADKAETHSKTGTTPPSSVDGLPEAYDFDDNIFGKDETYVKFEWDKDVI